jgi:NADH-quinone oxidoreductase subunit L
LFSEAGGTLALVQFIGAFTAIFAAIIAITQRDIKRILAFSTLSQLGYMLFSLGAAKFSLGGESGSGLNSLGYSAAMYHVFTHAFFKCMLFLGAGSLIHAVHSNDLMDMGGLKRLMPKTYWSLLVACLAIGGIFPLSGFWSKDAILLAALQSGHYITFGVGLVTGGLTAFYMFRFFFLAFHGEPQSKLHDVQEDPWMTFSIVALSLLWSGFQELALPGGSMVKAILKEQMCGGNGSDLSTCLFKINFTSMKSIFSLPAGSSFKASPRR